jgi:hypothetical protein
LLGYALFVWWVGSRVHVTRVAVEGASIQQALCCHDRNQCMTVYMHSDLRHTLCCTVLCCAALSLVHCPQSLDLQRGGNKRYQKTAAYGHFGRNHDPDFTWEQVVPLS